MTHGDLDGVVGLQALCFPLPFDPDLLWQRPHLERHLELFADGQFVAESAQGIVASCSNTLVAERSWAEGRSWEATVGGPMLDHFDAHGTTLYGLDISVHPDCRGLGLARALYQARFDLVKDRQLARYGTACRLPGYQEWARGRDQATPQQYADDVAAGRISDRTMTPLLKVGVKYLGVIENYMDDEESGNAAAKLEWRP